MANQILEDGTIETATRHADGSVGVTLTDPVTGKQSHYDSARFLRRELPRARPSWWDIVIPVAVAVLIAVGVIIAAYYER